VRTVIGELAGIKRVIRPALELVGSWSKSPGSMSTITYFSTSLCVSTERVTGLSAEPGGGAKALQRRTALRIGTERSGIGICQPRVATRRGRPGSVQGGKRAPILGGCTRHKGGLG